MDSYQNILCAIDLNQNAHQIIEKALKLASKPTDLLLLHVCDHPLSGFGDNGHEPATEVELKQLVADQMDMLCKRHGLTDKQIRVEFGQASKWIRKIQLDEGMDLIVLGSHGNSGLALLLGSTPDETLRKAHCDILTVYADKHVGML